MTNPLISVIIPVYNVGNYLLKCLDSCFSQTYTNIEVIAVNDGSTDNSGKMLDQYAENELRLKVIHQQNRGVVRARELGIVNSKGEYVCFVDSDDFIEKDMIYSLLRVALGTKADIVSCDFCICDDKTGNKVIKRNYYLGSQKEDILASLLLRYCTWSLWGKLFRRELFDSIKMPYGLRVGEDGLVCFQAYNYSRKVEAVNLPFYNYVQRTSSVTHTKKADLSLDILEFIEQIMSMKDKFHWGAKIDMPMNTFIASQMFVYYVNGGRLKRMIERIGIPFRISQMMSLDLRFIEKVGLLIFLKMNYISGYLRRLYIYATSC
mgnify:CR=1 FL=1